MTTFRQLFTSSKPIIGVIHLPALPGYPGSPGLDSVLEKAMTDLSALERGGVDGVLVENFADRPFRLKAGPETIAVMTRVVRELVLAAKVTQTMMTCSITMTSKTSTANGKTPAVVIAETLTFQAITMST